MANVGPSQEKKKKIDYYKVLGVPRGAGNDQVSAKNSPTSNPLRGALHNSVGRLHFYHLERPSRSKKACHDLSPPFPSPPVSLSSSPRMKIQKYLTTTLVSPLPPCFLACLAQIKSAYRRLALQCHPDKTKGDPEVCQESRHISLPPVLHRGFARFLPTSCISHLEAQQTVHPSPSSGIEHAKCMTRLLDSRPELEQRHCMERNADGTGAHISPSPRTA
jgi:hypothetical protein